jgi:acetate kinase
MNILVLNSGSSSQKCRLYQLGKSLPSDPPSPLWEGKIDWLDGGEAEVTIASPDRKSQKRTVRVTSRREAIEHLLSTAWKGSDSAVMCSAHVDLAGHRVVHGGPRYLEPTLVDEDVKTAIAAVSAFAPLHNRAELEGMQIVQRVIGAIPQIAVFDTGFHRHMPLSAKVYPGPYEWYEDGIHRYGFHGINHQYCAERAAHLLKKDLASLRVVSAHIGNGCSLAAVANGKSVDTTMGFTPLEGLMMGTRSGSVDPGILTYLMREKNLSGQQIDELLNKKSGLLGISGVSGDVRQIEQAASEGNSRAKLAWDIYIHRLVTGIGAMAASLGGLDVLLFTAGVGENSTTLRKSVCDRLAHLGATIDPSKNAQPPSDREISTAGARVHVLIVRAQEEWQIAKECWSVRNS